MRAKLVPIAPERVKLIYPEGGSIELMPSPKTGRRIVLLLLHDFKRRQDQAAAYDQLERARRLRL